MSEPLQGYRLSPQQRHLWRLLQEDGGAAYRACCEVRISGRVDPGALRAALDRVVGRHEILRTIFRSTPGLQLPLQVVTSGTAAWGGDLSALEPQTGPLLCAALEILEPGSARLTLVASALVTDGAGLRHLVRELAAACADRDSGEEPLQYADFSEWQNDVLEAEETVEERAFWKGREERASAGLALPGAGSPAAVFAPRETQIEVPREIGAALASLARRQGTELGPLLLAAWQILLFRLRGESGGEVAVAAAFEGRVHPSLERIPGLFVRYLPLLSHVEGGLRLEDVLGPLVLQMEEVVRCQEAFTWPSLPGGAEPHPTAAFEFVAEGAEEDGDDLAAAGFAIERLTAVCERFAVKLAAAYSPGRLRLELAYDPSVLAAEHAERLLARYAALLSDLAARPQAPVGELDLMAPADRRQLATLIETRRDLGNDRCLHDWIAEQAARTPERIAVACGDRRSTYAELMEQAGRVASALAAAGVAPEERVAICAERSLEMVAGILGVLAAGGAWVPLDPGAPRERLAYQLADARPAAVLLAEAQATMLPPHDVPVVPLETALSRAPEAAPRGTAVPENLAYVLYTSGSTGRPKGVAMSHRAIANRLLWMQRAFPLRADDRVLQKTPMIFDASIWELFLPLMTGARLVLAPPGAHGDPAALAAAAEAEGITVLQLVPSLLGPFLRAEADCPVPSLRRIFCGGEALPTDLARRALERGGTEIHNLYGPTECAIDATSWSCRSEDLTGLLVPIGQPIDNARVYLLNRWLAAVAPGVAGELCVGGVGLARGYGGGVERPDLTAERFLPDPFAGEPGARMYRTGDLARCRPDGALDFLGRVDHQVKVRGVRIELGEIEAVLREHPGLREAAVALHDGAAGNPRLVAYWVPAGEPAPGPGELRDLLARRLPDSMVPSAFVRLSDLPRTPGGKLDRRALPAPESAAPSAAAAVATRSMTEQVVAEIWAEVLGREQVGIHDDFFALGGHSLLATQTISRLRRVLGVELSLRSLFQTPTVAELAAQVDAALTGGRGRQAPPLVPLPRDVDLPLSFAQQRLWFLDQLDPGSPAYNLALSVRLRGALDTAAFVRSLTAIVGRHEVLRTSFPAAGGAPVQRISLFVAFAMPLVDLTGLPAVVRERETLRLAGAWARRPFDLARGPLLRALLLRTDRNEHVACLVLHHIVSDGWSTGILLAELSAAYAAFTAGHAPALPPLPVQYADFACWQREWLSGEVLEEQAAYWRERLGGGDLPPIELPTDRPRPVVPSLRGRRLPMALPQSLIEALAALGRQENTTLFMTLLAGFKALLHRYGGQDDVAVGTPIANRTRLEIERLIGFFVNTLVLRTRIEAGAPFRSLLAAVRETSLGAASHQDLPFEKLVEILQPERDTSRTPLFQVLFALQNAPGAGLELPGLSLAPLAAETGSSKFDLTLDLVQGRDRIRGAIEYSTDLFEETTIARLAGHLEILLTAAVSGPAQPISDLPLLAPAERWQLAAEWNDAQRTAAVDVTVHELFAARARQSPEAVAVLCGSMALSYGELDRRAERLAGYLRDLEVGPDRLVGICLDRTERLPVALLAVLKAGGGYVPLDPAYPRQRLELMVEDSRLSVLLTEERWAGLLPGTSAKVVLCELEEAAGVLPVQWTAPAAQADNLAYVIYTSGSTGRPKGVEINHRSLSAFLLAMQERLALSPRDRLLAVTSLSFDIAGLELYLPLIAGAEVVLVDRDTASDGLLLRERLQETGTTVLQATPSTWRLLLEAGWEGTAGLVALCGGEAWSRPLADPLAERTAALWNVYGPTETTVWSAMERIAPGAGPLSIGRPIADTQLHLLDRRRELVAVGAAAELGIGGVGLARGYRGRPDLTAERFVPDPLSVEPGARLYRTGDLARRLPDGRIEYLGRLDQQVKVRGFRIELGEIEAALARHPAVREAVVAARDETPGDHVLVAYVVAGSEPATAADLRSFLRERLPDFMVPAVFVEIDRLPLTANGKIDRRALPAPGAPRRERVLVPPRNEVEEAVARVWSQVLGRAELGVEDDFFALGGHSLLATQILSRLQQAFRVTIPLRSLFGGAATVAELSRLLVAAEARPGQAAKIASVLNRIERMSPEEVTKMVQQRDSRMSDGR